jgi:SAM-dependent methyltransferase
MMQDWFESAFDSDYLKLYAHRSEEEAEKTVGWLIDVVGLGAGRRVLDAPCGAGRHARAFVKRGMKVVGVDLSRDLLAAARSQSTPAERHQWVRADIRALPLQASAFDMVVNIFSSFGYFFDEAENWQVLAELVRALKHGGTLVLDFMNAPYIRANLVPFSERTTTEGWHVREWRRIAGTPARVEKRVLVEFGDGRARQIMESVRLYEPEELIAAFQRLQLADIRRFGDYAGAAWSEASPRTILIARKPA